MPEESRVLIEDFETIELLGEGSYSKVMLVRKKDTGEKFAMKCIRKAHCGIDENKGKKRMKRAMTERIILSQTSHPFIVPLHYAFQDEKNIYFALEYCQGGELFSLMAKHRRFTEDQYTAKNSLPNLTFYR